MVPCTWALLPLLPGTEVWEGAEVWEGGAARQGEEGGAGG